MTSPTLHLRPLLATAIAGEKEEFLRLTEHQFAILDLLGRRRRAAIGGCAGSGKTMLAVEKARRLSQQGFDVLITCFNRNLAQFLTACLEGQERIAVGSFHSICTELVKQARLGLPPARNPDEYFRETLPQPMIDALSQLGDRHRFDAIIVDEGQDFHENYWIALEYMLRDQDNGILFVFYDDNQALYNPAFRLPMPDQLYPLSRNLRNTREIFRFVNRFYDGDLPIQSAGPAGRPIELLGYSDDNQLKKLIAQQLHHLINDEKIPIDDLVVLTPRSRERTVLIQNRTFGNFRLAEPGIWR